MSNLEFWQLNREVESLSQLRHDLAGALGRLVTKATAMASHDPGCAQYYEGEARYWDVQRQEALKLLDQMMAMATGGSLPITHQTESGRTIQIINAGGDVVISSIDHSENVAVGKGLDQNVETS